jgi:hypothetical protein
MSFCVTLTCIANSFTRFNIPINFFLGGGLISVVYLKEVVCFLLGNSPACEFYMPTFRNTLFYHLRQYTSYLPAYKDGTVCSETSVYKIQTPRNYPEESIRNSEHGESLKSRLQEVNFTNMGYLCSLAVIRLCGSWLCIFCCATSQLGAWAASFLRYLFHNQLQDTRTSGRRRVTQLVTVVSISETKARDEHTSLQRNSNPRSQQSSGLSPTP